MSKKVLKFKNKQVGTMEIKNSAENENAQLYFYGDIVSDSWQSYWYDEDKCPQDILDFLNEIDTKYKGKNVLIVTHAGVCIYIKCHYEGEPKNNDYYSYKIGNCDVLTYEN